MSWLVAVPLAYVIARPMSALLGDHLPDQPRLRLQHHGRLHRLLAVLAIAFLASLIPAHAASRISVREKPGLQQPVARVALPASSATHNIGAGKTTRPTNKKPPETRTAPARRGSRGCTHSWRLHLGV
jgi:hypothetical protein